ncbi:Acyl-CoA N-acyltransferase [Penicillium malachiteum]|uniref:Acyl-CoA N-acyltransferase n=1 Tax=Penicillium malachiteum TaxID=1324776 RepID=UPI0025489D9C|nr:Acyl-CoA N-acyltransferase [Penicillium malachiteum]KAJ5736851.1 Acyl-CoA N-acyltransferase [Penicillium malachiteum]
MSTSTAALQHKKWTKSPYWISTDSTIIPVQTLNDWFATEEVYWAKPMPNQILRETLQNSLCFGLYHQPNENVSQIPEGNQVASEFIGIARCITDFTTFIYLTDVFILPSHQGHGLGTWLVECVQEIVESMPYLRRSLLFTEDWKRSVPFYQKLMGVEVHQFQAPTDKSDGQGLAVMMRKGKGNPSYQAEQKP